ncbi:hypothetical protein BWQ96_04043 [Gracilariopsis chorda]|uniref:AI-2E family transporter n=1 Tax=Gracilariopsis chorda TaxID=448386 RepID=A0A2V3IVJ3_9FLOR|nr:hypothetical protein BWQ96_04043 [Gracilariopsis chorda]|eukprot:PXF46166.1 hypothetical protein BWQ96_04043 [Gracilariopsis chorda]
MAFTSALPLASHLRPCRRFSPTHSALPPRPQPRPHRRRRTVVPPQCLSGREIAGVAVRTSEKALENLDAKRVASWAALAITLYALRSFFPVILGTFILGYVTNSVVRYVSRLTANRAPRRLIVGVFYAFIVTAISGFSLMTIPTVVREGQYFISTIQSENPYVYIANTMRKALGDDLTTKLEAYVITSVEMPEAAAKGTLPSSASSLSKPDSSKKDDSDVWTQARSRRLGILLQKSIRSYIAATITLITRLLGASTKVIFKAVLSLIFSFMIMWDLPVISRGVKRLKTSRLSFAYEELAPVVTKFGSVVGKSFEAQGLIATVNTALTTAGLLVLSIPGIGFLSVVTLVCSFIPVAGVFVSTLPMCIIALSEYGAAKAVAVIFMVILVHLIEAYVLNPQIYSAHLHLHPFMVLVVLYIAEHSYGIPGLLMAVPVSVYILRTIMIDDVEPKSLSRPSPAVESSQPAPE